MTTNNIGIISAKPDPPRALQRRTTSSMHSRKKNDQPNHQSNEDSTQCRCSPTEEATHFQQHQQLFQLLTGWRDWRNELSTSAQKDIDTTDPENISFRSQTPAMPSPAAPIRPRKMRATRWRDTITHYPPILHHLFYLFATFACLLVISNCGNSVQAQSSVEHESQAAPTSFIRGGAETILYANWSANGVYQDKRDLPSKSISSFESSSSSAYSADVSAINEYEEDDDAGSTNVGCSACRLLQKVEDLSIDSFKTHILQRLHLNQPPNITKPVVADNVLRQFYSEFGYRYIRLRPSTSSSTSSSSSSSDPSERMQGDEPPRPPQQQRHRHHSGIRQGPHDRHPEADSIIYEDESGEYEVDEEYYEPIRTSSATSSGAWRRRHHHRGGGGGGRRQFMNTNWRGVATEFEYDEDDGHRDDDFEELQELDDAYDEAGDNSNDDQTPYVDPFYSTTHSMFAFPKGKL